MRLDLDLDLLRPCLDGDLLPVCLLEYEDEDLLDEQADFDLGCDLLLLLLLLLLELQALGVMGP